MLCTAKKKEKIKCKQLIFFFNVYIILLLIRFQLYQND
jgi:hypothetical protein